MCARKGENAYFSLLHSSHLVSITVDGNTHTRLSVECNDNISSKFILRDLLLLASYIFGIYFFFKAEHEEYLPQLTEMV